MGLEKQEGDAPRDNALLEILSESFPEDVLETSLPQGDATVRLRPESLRKVMEFLKNDSPANFDVLLDVTALDYQKRKPRFEVVYHVLSLASNQRLRVVIGIEEEDPCADSVTDLWGSADWLEREVWDMFGIRFSGHPNLKRILLYEEFEGHPLRKDYPIRKRQPLIGPKN
jgi:NADH-quinone oxidoreductase subunit C